MTAIESKPSRTWAATHRLMLVVVAFAVVLAATIAIVLLTPSSSSSRIAPGSGPTVEERNPGPCELARVRCF